MTELTEIQLRFIETYITRQPLSIAGLDLATQADSATDDDDDSLLDDVATLRELMAKFGPPDQANAAETAELTGLQREAMSFLTPPLTKADVSAAAKVVDRMRAPHETSLRRIRRDELMAECAALEQQVNKDFLEDDSAEIASRLVLIRAALAAPAPDESALDQAALDITGLANFVDTAGDNARADVDRRVAKAEELRKSVDEAKVPNATATETQQIAGLAAKVTEGWATPPTWDQLGTGGDALKLLRQAADDIGTAVAARKVKGAELAAAAGAVEVDGADGDEGGALDTARKLVTDGLPEYPTPEQLAVAAESLAALEKLAEATRLAVAERIKRRDELLAAVSDLRIDAATTTEQGELDAIAARFPDLSGVPTRAVLDNAAPLLAELTQKTETIRAAVAARKVQSDAVIAVLDTLGWGAGVMVPGVGMPASLSDPIKVQADALAQTYAALRDPSKPDLWPETATDKLAALVTRITSDRDQVHAAMVEVNTVFADVQKKLGDVNADIASASIHQLSPTQQKVFSDQALAGAGLLKAAASEGAAAIAELAKVAAALKAFKVDLRGLALRIAAVDLTPANASTGELAELDKLHKAAEAELGKALP